MAALGAQVQAQVESILGREPDARTIAIRVESPQGLPESIKARGRSFKLRWCENKLALREALIGDGVAESGLVLATPVADKDLPADIAARLTRARVFQARDWELVRPLFGASAVDARLGNHEWLAQALVDLSVKGPYAQIANRFLDLDTAWREFLSRGLGLASARPDAQELLEWTLDPGVETSLLALDAAVLADVLTWFERECGPVGKLVAATSRAGRRMDSAAIATVCEVVFTPASDAPADLASAAVRLERYLGDLHVDAREARVWASEANALANRVGTERVRPSLDRADAILQDLRAAHHASIGNLTSLAFEQRLEALAETLQSHVESPTLGSMETIEHATGEVLLHHLAASRPLRKERVEMARRLARWLAHATPDRASYAELVAWQADEGAFVDWARFRLLGGDEHPLLSAAYSRLRQAVATRRQALNRRFATALTDVNRENRWQQGRAIPLERVLEDLVAPLMTGSNVLLLVMDGLSLSIFRELLARPELIGWKELVAEEPGQPWAGIAALPTMTEVSRASLLCGALRIGNAAQEKPAFAAHPALLQRSGKKPPVLFHKAEILDDTGLAAPLREAIADSNRRLVSVVYNAVDDHLGGPEQLHQSWNIEQLRGLMPLLHAARDARRTLVLTADHGHVLEESSRTIAGGDSDRWRPIAGKALAEGEIRFEGGRVLSPAGEPGVVCLIDEGLRYTGRKNGYHGGASLQEVCVPLSVFAPLGLGIEGWIDAPPATPEWWDLPLVPEPARPVERPRPARKPARGNDQQASLFGSLPVPEPGATAAPTSVWIDALLGSGTYLAQKQLAARVALDDKQMRTLLDALDARGGKLGWNALAQRLKVPELRLGGLLSAARRVLNVDQSPVLAWDEQSRTVELNRALLEQQFGISGKVRR